MFELHGRTALVTNAGEGLGAGIAKCLSLQGAAVAVSDLIPDRAEAVAQGLRTAGGHAIAVPANIADFDEVQAMVERTNKELGRIDVLVNRAGPPPGFVAGSFREVPVEEWDKVIRFDLYGMLYCTKAVLDGMCERGWGRVITISSEAARIGQPRGLSVYGAAKAGTVGLSRHLATELQGTGVTVNCLSLGKIKHSENDMTPVPRPTTRLGLPEDIGAAVVWLASNEGEWVTGQQIVINGGVSTTS